MKQEQRKRIIDKHRDSLTRHGHHPNALYWSSREIQELRFRVLAGIGIDHGDRLLDVGCGFGDFKSWFERPEKQLGFTGVDISPDLIARAEQLHPDADFYCGELSDCNFEKRSFDWVILSGAMNEQLHDDGDYARRQIRLMYQLSRKGVAFNMLDARHIRAHDLQSVDPDKMLQFCQSICPNCALHDEYLANDFTIYMKREWL